MLIYGINPVLEALRSGRVRRLQVSGRTDARLGEILRMANREGVEARQVDGVVLDRLTRGAAHQGVVAELKPIPNYSVEELVRGATAAPLIVVLDGVEDPQNLGAILRSADAAGADGVIQQTRRSAPLGAAAAKASAGAIAHIRTARVVNIARALEELQHLGVWTVGLAADGPVSYDEIDLKLPTAFVLGGEGRGLRRLVRERCDWLASIPMRGHVESLNVSVAAGIVLFEVLRQRRAGRSDAARSRDA